MIIRWHKLIIAALSILGTILTACQSGKPSSGQSPSPPSKTLSWEPPQTFTDGIPLVAARDLQRFEIFVKPDSSFVSTDTPIATAPPVDTTFDLETLVPPLTRGKIYYVSVRAVTVQGEKSDFSPAASFSILP